MQEKDSQETDMRGLKSSIQGQIAHHTKPLGTNPTECDRWMNLITLGCRMPKQMQKILICQWILCAVFLYVWVTFNGGLWPWFLKDEPQKISATGARLLDHFKHAENDGSKIIWVHAINSKASLEDAMKGKAHMLEADVLLQGQDTESMSMIPIMAHPPDVESDLTLKQWLDSVKVSKKGIKLDFKSIQAVEISLQQLKDIQDELSAPVHISADVLPGPNSGLSDVTHLDAKRFLRLAADHLPRSTLALGWTNTMHQEGTNRYSWTDVKRMYDLLDRHDKTHPQVAHPLSFNARVGLLRNSASQMRWLAEITAGGVCAYSSDEDQVNVKDVLYLQQRLPITKLFLDLHPSGSLATLPTDDDIDAVSKQIYADQQDAFKSSQWRVVKSREGETIYMGTESVLLQKGLLLTKEQHQPVPGVPVVITGRVEFLEPEESDPPERREEAEEGGEEAAEEGERGLEIFLRVTQSTRQDSISGVKCFLGFRGGLEIRTKGIPGADSAQTKVIPGRAPCFRYKLTDSGAESIEMLVTRPKSCEDMSEVDYEAHLELPMHEINAESYFLGIRTSRGKIFTAIDQFHIQH